MTTPSPAGSSAGVTCPANQLTSDQLRAIIVPRPVYKVGDAARALGLSRDAVCYHMRQRPRSFPPRDGLLARRHEWYSADEYLRVLWALCCLSPQAEKYALQRITSNVKF